MELLSVNIGKKSTQIKGAELETTGIYKTPVSRAVRLNALGLEQDFICDQKNHGGPDQAILIYGSADYDWWSRELGKALQPGTFGENLTVSNLETASTHIGDRLRIGEAKLQVTAPRIPCSTLAARMRDPEFVKKYRDAERPGLYCRVIEAGAIQAGDEVTLLPFDGETVAALEMFREHYVRDKNEAALRRILHAPISIRSRVSLERHLQRLLAGQSA